MRSTLIWGISESPWLVIPAKVWTPFTSTVRGPPLSPYDQASWTLVKIFSAHLIGATALSTRTQHRAFDCFVCQSLAIAVVVQNRNLGLWKNHQHWWRKGCMFLCLLKVEETFSPTTSKNPTSQTITPTIVGMTGSIQSPCFTGLLSHTFLGGLWPPLSMGGW